LKDILDNIPVRDENALYFEKQLKYMLGEFGDNKTYI